ncbi:MAG: polysaccharide biosynthesis/export family protein [Candidatus Sumerlaeia bacterium]
MKNLLYLIIALTLLAAGCSRPVRPPFDARDYNRYPGEVRPGEPAYVLNSGDELELEVRRHEEFSGSFQVDKQGKIRLPVILEFVHAEGLTVRELEQKISQVLQPYIVGEPLMELNLVKAKSKIVWVMGAVGKPGPYILQDERMYLRMLVAQAGFPLEEAAMNRTKLIRSDPDRLVIEKIHLRDILYWGDLTQNYEIRPGDVVMVPYSFLYETTQFFRRVLAPLRLINSFDREVEKASYIPRVLRRDSQNDDWVYDEVLEGN